MASAEPGQVGCAEFRAGSEDQGQNKEKFGEKNWSDKVVSDFMAIRVHCSDSGPGTWISGIIYRLFQLDLKKAKE